MLPVLMIIVSMSMTRSEREAALCSCMLRKAAPTSCWLMLCIFIYVIPYHYARQAHVAGLHQTGRQP